MVVAQNIYGDGSNSFDLSSTPSGTPEDSTPTTTTSTEPVSRYKRLKLQKGPWVSYFHKNRNRFILAGLFLLIQLSSITCRLVLHFLYFRLMFSIFSTLSGFIGFTIYWAFIPDCPPYLASKGGIPLYRRRRKGEMEEVCRASKAFVVPEAAVAEGTLDVASAELRSGVCHGVGAFRRVPDAGCLQAVHQSRRSADVCHCSSLLVRPQLRVRLATHSGRSTLSSHARRTARIQGSSNEIGQTKF